MIQRLHVRQSRPKTVAIVGFRDASLEDRVQHTHARVCDLGTSVQGISFEALEAMDIHRREEHLRPIDVFLVSVGEVSYASALLRNHSMRIMPMTRVLRDDVVEAIHRQSDSARFGVIANSPEYADRIIAELRRVRPASVASAVAIVDEADAVRMVIGNSDVILIGSVAASRLNIEIPVGIELIRFSFLPDGDTLNRLRKLLTQVHSKG
jgi:hypothetical protein